MALVLLASLDNSHRFFPLMTTRRLSSQVLPVQEIDADFTAKLYQLFAAYYDKNVTLARFESDLAEKDFIVVLRDTESGEPRGFSTQQILRITVDGKPIRALFSGDTIIDPDYWGEQELVRGWCRVVGQLLAEESEVPLYWLLISKGHRTYLYLPVFYHEFWPRYGSREDSRFCPAYPGFSREFQVAPILPVFVRPSEISKFHGQFEIRDRRCSCV